MLEQARQQGRWPTMPPCNSEVLAPLARCLKGHILVQVTKLGATPRLQLISP